MDRRMSLLEKLKLSNNQLSSEIPKEFKELKWLTDLDLHSNMLTGDLGPILSKKMGFTVLDSFGSYKSIDVSDSMFFGPIDEYYFDTDKNPVTTLLRSLILSRNLLRGSIPKTIGNWYIELEVLEMEENRLYGGIPDELGNVERLKRVVLAKNELSGSIPEKVLSSLRNMEKFDVSDNSLSGRIPRHVTNLSISDFEGNLGLCGSPLPPCK